MLGQDVTFFTAIGNDQNGQRIADECSKINLDISHALIVDDVPTSTYVYLCGPDGEMELAINDMRICNYLTPEYFEAKLEIINNSDLLIMDTNLNEESIAFLTEKVNIPIFADLVSTTKAIRLKPYLSRINTIKPNKIEAEILTGIKITDTASLKKATQCLLDMGVKNVYISLAEDGIFTVSEEGDFAVRAISTNIVNVTGAGDAQVAALAYAYLLGKKPEEAAMYANAAASIALESEKTVSDLMSIGLLEDKIQLLRKY